MIYDYMMYYFYPNFSGFVSTVVILWVVAGFVLSVSHLNTQNHKKTLFKVNVIAHICFFTLFMILLLLPDRDYLAYHFGDSRQLSNEQIADINQKLEKHYDTSKQLFLDCLEKGQKQPHTTVYNDTNEVVNTCYKVAQYKF